LATKRAPKPEVQNQTTDYHHSQEATQRPDVGVQDQFNTKKPPKTYRYDSSIDPTLSWDENRDRDLVEWLIGLVQRCAVEGEAKVFSQPVVWAGGGVQVQSLKACADLLQNLSSPFLNWTGKAERHQITIPTVPLFIHERHSTKAILDGIRRRKAKGETLDMFGDGGLDVTDKLDAYEHKGPWQNRMILGDSLQVMNSLLQFEGLGGQVQMIYMDPPYGVKFGSNFQPFVRTPKVTHGNDVELTREPEMVKAYRDTWELGLHSYLSYLRDRLLLSKELLCESGSIFVQISDDNQHHVRELLDEIFGANNFVAPITFAKTTSSTSNLLSSVFDTLLWYSKDKNKVKYRTLYGSKVRGQQGATGYTRVRTHDGEISPASQFENESGELDLPAGAELIALDNITSQSPGSRYDVVFNGKKYRPEPGYWKTDEPRMAVLLEKARIAATKNKLAFIRKFSDFPLFPLSNIWTDTVGQNQFGGSKVYVVQTALTVVRRCMQMCTDPGDLVFDPTCGSGTSAYVAEQWGRRWITCDTSRVPLALARQRLLTATFPYFELKDQKFGPEGGFVYKRRQNRKGEEIGGLVPHITLKSIANNETPSTEVLVDRPEINGDVVRVSGPFVVEATIAPSQVVDETPAPPESQSLDSAISDSDAANGGLPLQSQKSTSGYGDPATHIERMTQVLRQSKTLRLPGNRELVLADIRRMSDSDILHAEGLDAEGNRIAIVFGPEDGAISSDVVFEAAREAYFLKFPHLYFFGFAIQAKARELLEDRAKLRIPSTYVTVTPDVAMSDLLKTSRASEIFSVTGLPDAHIYATGNRNDDGAKLYAVELRGLDIFNPATMEQEAIEGQNMPAWMLDSDYDGMSFCATQVFFPKTSAWDNLQKSLKAEFDPSVWDHLAGTVSEPFVLGSKRRVAVKVIDERGNELMRMLEVMQ
jgi:adenine-specific DNA-methyltransferase